ncbi:MAG TPA: hypothetical protein VK724_19680 [Bryobacteraceae bacterium]|jgi:uncharacterized protein (TIGR03437 family)|nr:hypothetical protein [Bryobacteraceae bacterium]
MLMKSYWWKIVIAASFTTAAWAGTFGTVVSIGGEASDLALDETRGVLYIADFTGNSIDVMSLATNTVTTSINVAAQPSSIAMSPDGHYLVATNFGNAVAPASASNGLTVIDLTSQATQTFSLGNPPLGVAFGANGIALVVTTTDFLLFDPSTGATQEIGTLASVVANTLPVAPANFPADITAASVAASADGLQIYGLGGTSSTVTFRYDVNLNAIFPGGIVTSTGVLGPRVVSLNSNGSLAMAGWVMVNQQGTFVNYFPQHTNQFSVGSTAFDDSRGLLYAQIPAVTGEAPTLQVLTSNNLTLQERLQLPENLTGKSVLSSDSNTLYAISASGVTVLPVGSLAHQPQVVAQQEDLVFRNNFCSPGVATKQVTIVDPGGNNTPFSVSSNMAGVSVSPATGVTPAVVTVTVDPSTFANQTGTVAATLAIQSNAAVNVTPTVRVLVNNAAPEQVGSFIDIPGTLTDIVADPMRNQFFVVRSDKNEVLAFDGTSYSQTATLQTGNQPTTMAISFDQQYLLVGNQGSQIVNVFDLDTLQPVSPINLPSGFIALSIASSANATLAQGGYYDGTFHILQLDIAQGTGTELPTLGVFNNVTNANTVLTASQNGSSILIAQADGTVYLYDANSNAFTVSRQDFTSLAGPYAASAFNQYVVGNNLLDSSLVPVMQFETGTGTPSGFAFVDETGFRSNAPAPSGGGQSAAPGVIERIDMTNPTSSVSRAAPMVEAPLLGTTTSPFTRTIAPLANQTAIMNLTVSGVTVLPWNYDAAVAPPQITSIVNAGDFGADIAPGGLISVFGTQLSPVNMASSEVPLPTALANSCLSVNGEPLPVLFVSPTQVNAQMPFQAIGDVTLILHTPGGTSDNFNVVIEPNAPSVFLAAIGPDTNVPTVVRNDDNQLVTPSNPIHRQSNTALVIYLTGLGQTSPAVPTGQPAPANPLAMPLVAPTVTLGGVNLPVLFSGLAPGLVGVDQINVSVPFNVPEGMSVPLVITQGTVSTTLPERVVD